MPRRVCKFLLSPSPPLPPPPAASLLLLLLLRMEALPSAGRTRRDEYLIGVFGRILTGALAGDGPDDYE